MQRLESSRFRNPTKKQRYAFAILATFVAIALRGLLSPWFGTANPYHTVWAAVVVSAWYGGVGPAIVSTLLSLVGVWYLLLPVTHSFRPTGSEIAGMLGFALLCAFIIMLGEANRRVQARIRSAETTLREKESEFHLLADSIAELCWIANPDGHIFWYNQRWYEYTGTTFEQMEGWGWKSVHDPAILPAVLEKWQRSIALGESFEMEFPLRGADGVFRWFLTRIKPLHNSEGKIVRWFGTNTNIHQQRALRQALIEAREHLETRVKERTMDLERKTGELQEKVTLLDLANDAILVRDAEGLISYWNQGAERLYGWTAAEVLGHTTFSYLRTEFPVPLTDILRSDRWEGELRQYKRDGSPIIVASRWATVRDKTGQPIAWLEINTDITARKRAEEAARRLSGRLLTLQDEERRRIARGLHDSLGQYLAALKMTLASLANANEKQGVLVSECSDIVDKCLSETRTISHLLHPPLLDEAGLKSAIQWSVEGFAERSGIKVSLDLSPDLGRFHRDVETALFRVVQEALTNVHRHSGASEVAIRCAANANHVRLEIDDNGKGIAPEKLQEAVGPGAGSGVGLAGMRERIRELHGWLEIDSDSTGTLIKVEIPIKEKHREPATANRSPSGVSAA